MLKAALVALSLAVAMPCFAQQVRVITGEIEHVYGPGGKVVDDADLQGRNLRAWEHVQAEKQLEIERRQLKIERERLKLQQAAIAFGMAQDWDGNSTDGCWLGGVSGDRGDWGRVSFDRRDRSTRSFRARSSASSKSWPPGP